MAFDRLADTDVLAANTAYIAYIFTEKQITQRIPFTTEAVPPVGDAKWKDNTAKQTSVDKLKLTLSIPNDEIIAIQTGETLLIPIYTKTSYSTSSGVNFLRSGGTITVSCTAIIGNCFTPIGAGYKALDTEVFKGDSNYKFHLFGIQSIVTEDLGRNIVRIGGVGADNLTLSTD